MSCVFISNDLNTISLHDMVITEVKESKDNIILVFDEGFAVTKDNEKNKTQKHMQTGAAFITLYDSKFIRANNLEKEVEIAKEIVFSGELEVLEETLSNDLFKIFYSNEDHNFCEAYFSYSHLECTWNEFVDTAWF